MSSLRANFGDLLEPGLRKIFDDKFKEMPEVFSSIFHVNSSETDTERDSAMTGFGLLTQTGEGSPITYEDPVQMYDTIYVHAKYTKGFRVSEELWEDDRYNVIRKKPAALAKSCRRTAEFLASNVFNNGFSTSFKGGDAVPLFSTVHPRADGGTSQSNASGTGITLTEANLNTALLAMRNQLDDKGMKIAVRADTIIVPPALEKTAQILTNSKLRPGTADNDFNYYEGLLKVISWDWLTSTTCWFILDSSEHELQWFWRIQPEFKQDNSFDTGMALYKARQRSSTGWSDWRGTWGSAGDGNVYSS